ncbi:MAG TPA: hypothetical protein VIJ14_05845 [Rhabdochlamydiaceae bacterium]
MKNILYDMKPTNPRMLDRYFRFCSGISQSKFNGIGEWHHIVPSCVLGDNSPTNYVLFPIRAHFLAHLLLARAFKNHEFTGFGVALFLMAQASTIRHPNRLKANVGSSRYYEEAKIMAKQHMKELWKLRKPWSEETRKRVSDAKKLLTSVTNGVIEKKIKKTELESFLLANPGWRFGRCNSFMDSKPFSNGRYLMTKKEASERSKGKIRVFDISKPGSKSFMIPCGDLGKDSNIVSHAKLALHDRSRETGRFIKRDHVS